MRPQKKIIQFMQNEKVLADHAITKNSKQSQEQGSVRLFKRGRGRGGDRGGPKRGRDGG